MGLSRKRRVKSQSDLKIWLGGASNGYGAWGFLLWWVSGTEWGFPRAGKDLQGLNLLQRKEQWVPYSSYGLKGHRVVRLESCNWSNRKSQSEILLSTPLFFHLAPHPVISKLNFIIMYLNTSFSAPKKKESFCDIV